MILKSVFSPVSAPCLAICNYATTKSLVLACLLLRRRPAFLACLSWILRLHHPPAVSQDGHHKKSKRPRPIQTSTPDVETGLRIWLFCHTKVTHLALHWVIGSTLVFSIGYLGGSTVVAAYFLPTQGELDLAGGTLLWSLHLNQDGSKSKLKMEVKPRRARYLPGQPSRGMQVDETLAPLWRRHHS